MIKDRLRTRHIEQQTLKAALNSQTDLHLRRQARFELGVSSHLIDPKSFRVSESHGSLVRKPVATSKRKYRVKQNLTPLSMTPKTNGNQKF